MSRANKLYESAQAIRANIKSHESEIARQRQAYESEIHLYRIESVSRVLDFVRSEYRQGRVCNLDSILCHCQNKLYGNIDGIELPLNESGVPFQRLEG